MVSTDYEREIDFGLLAKSGRKPVHYSAGDVIFARGADDKYAYAVTAGEVELRAGETVIEVVTANGMFGELALIEPRTRTTTALAKTDVTLVSIDRRSFLFLIAEEPKFALNVLRLLTRRLRVADGKYHG